MAGLPYLLLWVGLAQAVDGSTTAAIELGDPQLVPNARPPVPIYPWFPDGHLSLLREKDGRWSLYWAGASSYRSVGQSLQAMQLDPQAPVLQAGQPGSFDNGGAWLMSVHRRSDSDLIGFYHAEDHQFGEHPNPDKLAWKSIALCRSADNGRTWIKSGLIITSSHSKPASPEWGGTGDHCVVWDPVKNRWVCFAQEHFLYMAVSEDPEARPGSWRKWSPHGTAPGLGGPATPIDSLKSHPGGNPSVHFNRAWNRWFMVWHTWRGDLVCATSPDLEQWDKPRTLLSAPRGQKVWYPTILDESEGGDLSAGEQATLLYALWPDRERWQRQFVRRPIRFLPTTSP